MMIRSNQYGIQWDSDNEADIQAFSRSQTMLQRHSRCNSDLQPHSRSTSFCLSTCLVSTQDFIDLRDVVKDSMYLEEVSDSTVKHRDSPRPFPLPNASAVLKESLPVRENLEKHLGTLNSEGGQLQTSSYEANGGSSGKPRVSKPSPSPGTIVKLMGLDSMPYSSSPVVKTGGVEHYNPIMKPVPWKYADGTQKQPLKHVKLPSKTSDSSTSIYSEIEKRLKDRGNKQPGKDLRALKQILEALQGKGLLETKKDERTENLVSQRDYEPELTSSGPNLRGLKQILEAQQAKGFLRTVNEEQTANLVSQQTVNPNVQTLVRI
ncbi:hypothetical protein F3Y22_tig00112159pilonHSYRG00307 [Hibiscus syriacus]|uniref:DUF3741 domain-containing protein n=1 Tax=Hibiscus syriacus TaxID=106335 RepID=A0A6A2X5B1_HIBSY|nr:hypothetical protein F3Y22_tig00112159pilonHSYRG00307 [Hibiscus syriacus]